MYTFLGMIVPVTLGTFILVHYGQHSMAIRGLALVAMLALAFAIILIPMKFMNTAATDDVVVPN